jgi:MarR family transcriptional regulator, transcriptional regulator for hemolysin
MQDDPNQSFGFVIHDIARLLRRNFDRRAQSVGLTRAQWSVLVHLRRQDGIRQNELANLLEVQPISLTRMIDRLVKSGLVERRNDPKDRRANRIFLTKKVHPLLTQLRGLGKETREEAFADIPQAERERFMETLLKIRANVAERGSADEDHTKH